MDMIYTDFFNFLKSIVDPLLPDSAKENKTYKNSSKDFSDYVSTVKGFAYVNATIGEMCKSESTQKSVKNIVQVAGDATKLKESVVEIKTLARKIAEYCTTLAEKPDEEISDKIETFALYVDTITRQFIK